MLVDEPHLVTARLRASEGPVHSVNVAYYASVPGMARPKLVDRQTISQMQPGLVYEHRTRYRPQQCGKQTLIVWAWAGSEAGQVGEFETSVTIEPLTHLQALITATRGITMPARMRARLVGTLHRAVRAVESSDLDASMQDVASFVAALEAASGTAIDAQRAGRLIGQAVSLLACVDASVTAAGRDPAPLALMHQ